MELLKLEAENTTGGTIAKRFERLSNLMTAIDIIAAGIDIKEIAEEFGTFETSECIRTIVREAGAEIAAIRDTLAFTELENHSAKIS